MLRETIACAVIFILAGVRSQKLLIASYDVVDSFHSHFMESLSLHLSDRYHVTFMTNGDALVEDKDIYGLPTIDFVYKTDWRASNQSVYTKVEVTDISKSQFQIIRQVKLKTEEGMRSLFSQPKFLDQLRAKNYSCMLYNSMDYGMPVVCRYLGLTCLQVITSGLGGPNNPLGLELMNSVPHTISSDTNLIGLRKKLKNTLFYIFEHYLRISYFYPGAEAIAKEYGLISPEEKQSFWQLAANTPVHSIIYTNDAIDCNIPLSESYSRVGGAMLSNPQLDSHYQTLMDAADQGAVLVAFGKGAHQLPLNFFQELITCFGSLPYTFILAAGSATIELQSKESMPPNIHLAKSVPQNSLLGHPNCLLFVTHAGIGSMTEAIYHAVPVITIPFYADQQKNADKLTKILKMGTNIASDSLQSATLKENIQRVINDSSYKSNAESASVKMRTCGEGTANDRLMNAVEMAVNTPASQTRPDTTKHWVHFVQVEVLIVLAVIIACFFVLIVGAVLSFKWIISRLSQKSIWISQAGTLVISYTLGGLSVALYHYVS